MEGLIYETIGIVIATWHIMIATDKLNQQALNRFMSNKHN